MAGRIPPHMRRGLKQAPGVPKHAAIQRDLRDPVEKAQADLDALKALSKGVNNDKVQDALKNAEACLKAAKKAAAEKAGAKPEAEAAEKAAKKAAAEKAAEKAAAEKAAAEKKAEAEKAAAEKKAEAAEKKAEAEKATEKKAVEAKAVEAKAKAEAAASEKPAMPKVDMSNTREELDAAAKSVGVEAPEKMSKKQDVFDALVKATK